MDQTNIKICCIPFIWRDYTSSKPNSGQDHTSTYEPFERIDQLIHNTSLWDWCYIFLWNRGLLIKWICTLSWPDIMRVRISISSCAWGPYRYFVSSLALAVPGSKVQHTATVCGQLNPVWLQATTLVCCFFPTSFWALVARWLIQFILQKPFLQQSQAFWQTIARSHTFIGSYQ